MENCNRHLIILRRASLSYEAAEDYRELEDCPQEAETMYLPFCPSPIGSGYILFKFSHYSITLY
jgi:hypothetical protein